MLDCLITPGGHRPPRQVPTGTRVRDRGSVLRRQATVTRHRVELRRFVVALRDAPDVHADFLAGEVEFVGGLQVHPEIRRVPKQRLNRNAVSAVMFRLAARI